MAKVTELFRGKPRELKDRAPLCEKLVIDAGDQAQQFAEDLAGFVIVVVDSKGRWSLSSALASDNVIGKRMLAGLAISAIQEELIMSQAMRQFAIDQGWARPPPSDDPA